MSEKHSTLTPVNGVPVDVPVGSHSTGASAQVSRVADQTTETNTPARDEPERPSRRHSKRAGRGRIGGVQLARIAEVLSDRDRQLLGSIAEHSYLSSKHIEGLWSGGPAASTAERLARRAMTRLERVGLVQPLERRVGASGRAAALTSGNCPPPAVDWSRITAAPSAPTNRPHD